MYFLLKMGIFHCYVSLPEGNRERIGAGNPGFDRYIRSNLILKGFLEVDRGDLPKRGRAKGMDRYGA